MLLLFSKTAAESEWVKIEWETKFLAEIEKKRIHLLPALLEDCALPPILARRKYADFRESYNGGLEQILLAIGHKKKASNRSNI
ncbi:MAG: toll/interleukin-1 receptor domain-containing protein [Rhizobiales bacterium]|nr:toll/interleukin-1 receptor domain-containing protein [Hyphomicrobiales bacterium]